MIKSRPDQPIRVLIVEDSRSQLALLVGLLHAAGNFEIVGTVTNGREALSATQELRPHVVAMDIHLPGLDGYAATRQIMEQCPTPIVLISSTQTDTARRALDALAVGALAVVEKPGSPHHPQHADQRATFVRTLRLMAGVPVVTRYPARPAPVVAAVTVPAPRQVLGIAASTGGPAAVQSLLNGLGAGFPLPILLVQHIAAGFAAALIDWLGKTTPLPIGFAQAGEALLPGHVYLAPDRHHLLVQRPGVFALLPSQPTDPICPSADRLFGSLATVYGPQAIGVILTGMGDDGARGLLKLQQAHGLTLAQDEQSSIVYGMPRAAVALGAVARPVPLSRLPALILQATSGGREGLRTEWKDESGK